MAVRLTKPWRALVAEETAKLRGQLGVYEIADEDGTTVFIGMAGGRSLFGLKGELERERAEREPGRFRFRVEVNMSYQTRWRELLMVHRADHGELPAENRDITIKLGRLSPG